MIADGHQLKRESGKEYSGPCIFCGGVDRLRVFPDEGEAGRYWCRKCKKSGDAIQYLRDYRELSFQSACQLLGKQPKKSTRVQEPVRKVRTSFEPQNEGPVGTAWKSKANEFVHRCINNLYGEYQPGEPACIWRRESDDILKWLKNKRGLTNETIKNAGLGWNPRDYFPDRESWGLESAINEKTGKPKTLWLPKGLVIPTFEDEDVTKIKIRRFDLEKSNNKARYVAIKGGLPTPSVFGCLKNKAFGIVESELDALLIYQEAGDLVTAISLGGAQNRPGKRIHEALKDSDIILVSLDNDEAGVQESQEWWLKEYSQAKRWKCLEGKDPTEMHMNEKGLKIRIWIKAALSRPVPKELFETSSNDTFEDQCRDKNEEGRHL